MYLFFSFLLSADVRMCPAPQQAIAHMFLCMYMCILLHVTSLCMSGVCCLAFDESPLFLTFSRFLVLLDFVQPHCTVFLFFSLASLIHPSPPSTPCCSTSTLNNSSLQSWCIFGCCHLCNNTNTAHTSEPARIITHTCSPASMCVHTTRRFTQTKLPTAPKKYQTLRLLRLTIYKESSLQGFHTITVLHPIFAVLSQQ